MDIYQAIFLGIVQGVTEVLPISSSGHLILVPWFFGFDDPGLAFSVALHIGTLLAIIVYFRKDWLQVFKGFSEGLKNRRFKTSDEKLPLFIVLATIPGVLAGYFLNDIAESAFRSPYLVALMLIFFGYVLILAERMNGDSRRSLSAGEIPAFAGMTKGGAGMTHAPLQGTGQAKEGGNDPTSPRLREAGNGKNIKNMTAKRSLLIGIFQALAIIPGVSRSGITISAGMFQGFTREAAARFSFLISAPIILGAGVFEMKEMTLADFQSEIFWAGLVSSVIASFLTVRFLMNFVKTHKLNIFALYRFVLAGLIIFYLFIS